MKKRVLTYLLIGFTFASLAGCSSGGEETDLSDKAASEADNSEEDGQNNSDSSTQEETAEATTDSDSQVLELLSKYVDIDAYKAGNGQVDENQSEEISDEIQVDGETLKLGMNYDEVVGKGFEPADADFMNTETDALTYTCEFTTPADNTVTLGFIGAEEQTVADGVLYSVKISYLEGEDEIPAYEVMGVNETAKIQDLLDALGEPYSFNDPAWSDFPNAGFRYACFETSRYLTCYMNLETEEPVTVTLEGYGPDGKP